MPHRMGNVPRFRMLGRSVVTTRPSLDEDGHPSAALAIDPMTADLVGPERVRRHPHRGDGRWRRRSMPHRMGNVPRFRMLGRSVVTTRPSLDEDGHPSAALAIDPMTADLVGPERVRRHPHRRARSAPPCGVSRGPRAYRIRVPIPSDRRRRARRSHLIPMTAASTSIDIASAISPWRQRARPVMQGRERQSDEGDRALPPPK